MKSTFARRMSILLVLAMVLAMLPVGAMAADSTTLYLQPNSNWLIDSARFAAYFYVGTTTTWVDMTATDTAGVYEVTVPEGDWTHVIFCRMNPGTTENNWDNKWNQTGDIALSSIPEGMNLCSINADQWDCGSNYTWSAYTVGDEVTEATSAPKNFDYYVAGSFNNWSECNDDYGMTAVDGVYSVTFAVEAGSHTMKITNGTWTDAIGTAEGGDIPFSCATAGDVTVTYNPADGTYAITGDCLGDAPLVENPIPEGTVLNVKGTLPGLDWAAETDTGLMTLVDGVYTLTIADVPASEVGADPYQFKIMFNNSWDTAYPSENWTFYLTDVCDVTITMDATYQTINATAQYMTFEAPTDGSEEGGETTDPETPVEITSVNVMGTITGLSWTEAAEAGAMTLGEDGIYTVTIDGVAASEVGADAYAFKVLVNGDWDNSAYPESNYTFYMSAEGSVTITYNPETNEVTLTGENVTYEAPVDPEAPENTYGVVGGLVAEGDAGWAAESAVAMTKNEDGTYSVVFSAVAAGDYEIKVIENGSWDVNYGDNGNNYAFNVSAECDVTVSFDPATSTVSVTGTNVGEVAAEALVVDKVVIAGGVTGDDTASPGNMFNSMIWAVDPTYTVNMLRDTTDTPGVYSITFYNVAAGSYDFKFVVNDNWDLNYSYGLAVESGTEVTAWFNALGNSTVVVAEDNSTVTFELDLTGTANVGDDAKMTVTIEVPEVSELVTSAPEQIVIGNNDFSVATGNNTAVTAPYTATFTGTLYIHPTAMATVDAWTGELTEVPSEYVNGQFGWFYGIVVDGVTVYGNTVAVVEGQTYQIGVIDTMGGGCTVTLTVCSGHNFTDYTCSVCGLTCTNHNWSMGVCQTCGEVCAHETWANGNCQTCWMMCEHSWTYNYTSGSVHNFTCGGLCGTVIELDVNDVQFKIASAQPELASNIVMYLGGQLPAGMEYPRIEVEFNGETSYLYDYTINSKGRYEFAFDRINPKTMGDTFTATLYATVEGYEVSAKLEYSMLKYLNSQLKKTSLSAKNRTVMSDLIAYGDANQLYASYKTDALISTQLAETATLTPSTFTALADSYNVQKVSGVAADEINFKTVSLLLDSKVVISVKVYCPNPEGYTVNVNLAGVDYTYPVSELEAIEGEDGYYYLNFEEVRASQFDEVVTVSFLNPEGAQVSRTLEYSVYTYIQKNQNKTDSKLVALLQAIYNYGEAAKAL